MADTTMKVMSAKDMNKVTSAQRVSKVFVYIFLYAFLGIMALIVLFPFYWMLISSVKSMQEYNLAIPTLWPQTFVWKNYIDAFDTANLGTLFMNTVYVGVVSTLLSLVITVLSAFAFARRTFLRVARNDDDSR